MLRSLEDLRGLTIRAADGEIGTVDQFLFDDERWTVRYMVVNTGSWLLKDLVLISPRSLLGVDWEARRLNVNLSRKQVEEAPDISTDRPVSRQMEARHAAYYGYQPYWTGPSLWGAAGFPYHAGMVGGYGAAVPVTSEADRERARTAAEEGDEHLRSTREVHGYHLSAVDGEIGHVSDFIMEDETWAIRYLVVDTRNWWPGKHVLVAPGWVRAINWLDHTVEVDLTRDAIKQGPAYDPEALNRDYEQRLYSHYGRRGYWEQRAPGP